MTKGGRFCPGHDSRLKSRLNKAARAGDREAYERLCLLGWATENTFLGHPDQPAAGDPPAPVEKPVIPPAVEIYRGNTHCYPPKTWWPYLDKVIGRDDEDLDRWGRVVFLYVGTGWNPKNVNNMLRFYLNGEQPGQGYAQNGTKTDAGNKKEKVTVTV